MGTEDRESCLRTQPQQLQLPSRVFLMARPRVILCTLYVFLCVFVSLSVSVSVSASAQRLPYDPVASPNQVVQSQSASAQPLPPGKMELLAYDPVASPNQVVQSQSAAGTARFTVLTDRLIRMQWTTGESAEDCPTVAVLHRNTNYTTFTHTVSSGVLTIATSKLTLRYTTGQAFSPSSLSISQTGGPTWHFGDADDGNLLGTIRTLDQQVNVTLNCTENAALKAQFHCAWGLVSRNGWAVMNDTRNQCYSNDLAWWTRWSTDAQDLYFFGHGQDYKGAVADYALIGGKVPMLPRRALGLMWTRWYDLNAVDTRLIVEQYESRRIPLDIFILDMDWHGKEGWTGWTFDKRLFPFPAHDQGWLVNKGLGLAYNLHDASGVAPYEEQYKAMAAALHLPDSFNGTIPFNITTVDYLNALQDTVLTHIRQQGSLTATTWWSDWQQGDTAGGAVGGKQNPTIAINKVRGTEYIRRGDNIRSFHLARWGGMGNHRYVGGFSGDVKVLDWADLAYQPYFSSTAANVLFSGWSHDLEGPGSDHEMYVRWLQWGAYSGAFRSHDRGMSAGGCSNIPGSCSNVRVWELPTQYFDPARAVMQRREELVPYMYNAARAAFDTGLTMLYPVYYEFPTEPMAYTSNSAGDPSPTYMFGPDMLLAPIVFPADNDSMANASIWVPPGTWYEQTSGMLYSSPSTGGMMLHKQLDLSETPVFIRGGAVIPTRPLDLQTTVLGLAARQYTELGFEVYPGAASGSVSVYEDDGETMDYLTSASSFAHTTLTYSRSVSTFKATVSTSGSYPSLPTTRTIRVTLFSSLPPSSLTANGAAVPHSPYGCPSTTCWTYDGQTAAVVVTVFKVNTVKGLTLSMATPAVTGLDDLMSGVRGAIQHAILGKRLLDATRRTPGCQDTTGHWVMDAAATGDVLEYHSGDTDDSFAEFLSTLTNFRSVYTHAIAELDSIRPPPPLPASALVQLWSAGRSDHVLCGSPDCLQSNGGYAQKRAEGYMPPASDPNAIPFNDFWSGDYSDNYATSQTATPVGYSPAVFSNGFILGSAQPGAVPLKLYYQPNTHDHMAVATAAGEADAKAGNYSLINGTLGWVYTSPQSSETSLLGEMNEARWLHTNALFTSAFV